MGVAGTGKTLIGRALGAELGWRFVDGDGFHSEASIAKMRAGIALDDEDRADWLRRLHAIVARSIDRRENLVLACSALKERYRQTLRGDLRQIRFVHLTADEETLRRRLESRAAHFAGAALLRSQIAALEPPSHALTVDATRPPERTLWTIRSAFGL
jgi:gluconokinase